MTQPGTWRDFKTEPPPAGEYVLFRNTRWDGVPAARAMFLGYCVGRLLEERQDNGGTLRWLELGGFALAVSDVGTAAAPRLEWTEVPRGA